MVFQTILNQDMEQIKAYKKLNRRMYSLIEEFFKKHLELAFLGFDFQLIL
jgi:hypothetical protein|tara:strand:- start:234 stop:383 length:150 start_codon:yes stop_codon:yes gene_type:complete